jgi:hypothetical protein
MAFTFVQSAVAPSTNAVSFSAPSTSADLVKFFVMVAVSFPGTAPTVMVADNGGVNVYTLSGTPALVDDAGAFNFYLYDYSCFGFVAPGGNLTITGTASTVLFYGGAVAAEYGVPRGTIIDPSSYATGSNPATVGMPVTTTLTKAGELLVFAEFCNGTLGSPATGWNLRANNLIGLLDNLTGPATGTQTLTPISQTAPSVWEATLTGFYTPVAPAGGGVGGSLVGPYNFWGGGFN